MQSYEAGSWVWVPDEKEMFLPGKVVKTFKPGEDGQVKMEDGKVGWVDGGGARQAGYLTRRHCKYIVNCNSARDRTIDAFNNNSMSHNSLGPNPFRRQRPRLARSLVIAGRHHPRQEQQGPASDGRGGAADVRQYDQAQQPERAGHPAQPAAAFHEGQHLHVRLVDSCGAEPLQAAAHLHPRDHGQVQGRRCVGEEQSCGCAVFLRFRLD